MALNSLYCADVPLSNYSLTRFVVAVQFGILCEYKLKCLLTASIYGVY